MGLIAELCSEAGFGWHRRVMMIARLLTEPAFGERERGIGHYLSKKYRHNTDSVEGARQSTVKKLCSHLEPYGPPAMTTC